jgi:hypothetical protein
MFRIQMKWAALVSVIACAAVLAQPGRAAAQSDRPPGLKGYALVQWMDERRTRAPLRGEPSRNVGVTRSYSYPQPHVYVQSQYLYRPTYAFTTSAVPTGTWGGPVGWPCGGR